ncbi:hypothetical protein M0812_13364 [Anaeramoeba flamelloides]|uniref:MACPF domain-containing protein n=1 Tax=Anaeramoeba flamelloides TaxID=1746091 RepID=A0AAV7ZNF7_9EUKA|nr:hypothetical protein M0812_13364 [Anaeramoeba flamelloides]|eukprot:Anaeramoba_flamelloidesa85322_2950.p1 GENE.a85322_2950~~a85322_2950.p1  ORF type:complete len:674 (+),score=152.82 a85322_2950:49-2070(+)
METRIFFFLFLICFCACTTTEKVGGTHKIGLGMNPFTTDKKMQVWDINNYGDEGLPQSVIKFNSPSSQMSMEVQIIDHLTNITDSKHYKLEASAHYMSIGGSFSTSYDYIHKYMSKSHYKVAQITGNVELYQLQAQINEMKFSTAFNTLADKIMWSIEKNTTASADLSVYLTDKLLNMFGTHVTTGLTLGGTCQKLDVIDSTMWSNYNEHDFSVSAKASFASYFSISGSYSASSTQLQQYSNSKKDTQVYITGGAPWPSNGTYNEWLKTLPENPAVINAVYYPISYVIQYEQFSYIDRVTFRKFIELVENRTALNILQNTHYGCMDPDSPSFDYSANVNDPNRCKYNIKERFGGLFQVSDNPTLQLTNELTQDFTCPEGYVAYPLQNPVKHGRHHHDCHRCWIFSHCCHNWDESYTSQLYVCLNNDGTKTGEFFGGAYYDKVIKNEITDGFSCPDGYYDHYAKLDPWDSSKGIHFCVAPFDSGNIDTGVHVGGFFSSFKPNPFTNKFVCPKGYRRVSLGNTFYGKEMVYCIGIDDMQGRIQYIPPGYGNEIPSLVDYYYVLSEKQWLQVNITDQESYEEQYQSSYALYQTYLKASAKNKSNDDNKPISNKDDKNDKSSQDESSHSSTATVLMSVFIPLAVVALSVTLFILNKKRKNKFDPEKGRILLNDQSSD